MILWSGGGRRYDDDGLQWNYFAIYSNEFSFSGGEAWQNEPHLNLKMFLKKF